MIPLKFFLIAVFRQFPLFFLSSCLTVQNEKYVGQVILQKTVSTGAAQIENDGLMERYLYIDTHEAIISDEMFVAVQQEKLSRFKEPRDYVTMKLSL